MFTEQLLFNNLQNVQNATTSLASIHTNALEFQYQLCQIFLKKTGSQLHQKQLKIMIDTQELMLKISQKDMDKDQILSTDSDGEDVTLSTHSDHSNRHVAYLKRSEIGVWKKIQNKLSCWLSQIEQKCSALCLGNIKLLISDYKRLIDRWYELESRQSLIQRKTARNQQFHEQNIILKEKVKVQDIKIQTMQCQIDILQQKNQSMIDYTNKKFQEIVGNQKMIEINGKVYRDVKNYLQDKQRLSVNRFAKIEEIQKDIIVRLTNEMSRNACESCCGMLKRIKDSIINFKRYLDHQGAELDQLFTKYKKVLFSPKVIKCF